MTTINLILWAFKSSPSIILVSVKLILLYCRKDKTQNGNIVMMTPTYSDDEDGHTQDGTAHMYSCDGLKLLQKKNDILILVVLINSRY